MLTSSPHTALPLARGINDGLRELRGAWPKGNSSLRERRTESKHSRRGANAWPGSVGGSVFEAAVRVPYNHKR
jgi:hypothetical protein